MSSAVVRTYKYIYIYKYIYMIYEIISKVFNACDVDSFGFTISSVVRDHDFLWHPTHVRKW